MSLQGTFLGTTCVPKCFQNNEMTTLSKNMLFDGPEPRLALLNLDRLAERRPTSGSQSSLLPTSVIMMIGIFFIIIMARTFLIIILVCSFYKGC